MQILCATHTSVRSAGRACVITVIHAALMFCSLHNANPLSHTHLSTFRRRGVCYHSHPRSPDVLFTARCKSSVPYTPQYVQQEGRVLSQSSKQPWCFVHCTMQILCATHTSARSAGGACVITVIQAVSHYFVQCRQLTYSFVPYTPQYVQQEGRVGLDAPDLELPQRSVHLLHRLPAFSDQIRVEWSGRLREPAITDQSGMVGWGIRAEW